MLTVALGCGPPAGECRDNTTTAALVGGAITGQHPSVMALSRRREGACPDAADTFCTGTLVSPDQVLTAAHCVARRQPGDLEVRQDSGTRHEVLRLWVHQGFDPDTWANDLAILVLREPLAVTPSPLGARALEPGQAVTLVGYGIASDGPPGQKREGTAMLREVTDSELAYVPGPAMTCGGDSGSPVFVAADEGLSLAGVTSRGDAACASYGIAARATALPDLGR